MEDLKKQNKEPKVVTQMWEHHLLASQKFKGTDQKYCEENELSLSAFNVQKKRLGLTGRTRSKAKAKFVRMEPETKPQASISIDPKWFAEVLFHLNGLS